MIYAENILLCFSVPLLMSLLLIRGSARIFVFSFLCGMVVCLLSAYVSSFSTAISHMGAKQTAIYISPIVEEAMKMLPLLFSLFVIEPADEVLLLLAVGLGTGFATFENSCYILSSGAGSVPYILIRGMAVGVMHIVSIFVLALGLVLARRFKALSVAGILGALSLSMTFHGLYNLLVSEPGATSVIGYAMPLLAAALLYVPYRRFRE